MSAPIISTLLAEEPEMHDLVDEFISSLPDSIHRIRQAAIESDWGTYKKQVHDLKGLGGNFGFPALSQLARQLETETNTQSDENIRLLLDELDSVHQRIQLGQAS